MRILGKLQCFSIHWEASFPTYYFNKKKCFSLLSPLLFTHNHSSISKKKFSLSSLIRLSSFLNLKKDANKREKKRWREREERASATRKEKK